MFYRGYWMREVYLGLGSNLGDRFANLVCCLQLLQANRHIAVVRLSSIYETEPFGFADQPWFLNMVIEIETDLKPLALLETTQQIEEQMGRVRMHHWGPRLIDIDILSFGNTIVKQPKLHVPHQLLQFRKFVLMPLKEIASGFVHPELNKGIDQLLAGCQDGSQIRLFMAANKFMDYLTNGKTKSRLYRY